MVAATFTRRTDLRRLLCGLSFKPANVRRACLATAASVVFVVLFIAVLDGVVFRRSLPVSYVAFYRSSPLVPRMLAMCILAALDELKFRLMLMTLMTVVVAVCRGRLTTPYFIAIIAVSQFANVGGLVLADPLYAGLRYWLVGSVWGWLYWRHGWLAAFSGHTCAHVLLDPLLFVALQ